MKFWSLFFLLLSQSAFSANLVIGLSSVGGDACSVHGDNVPLSAVGNDLYRLRSEMNTSFSPKWIIGVNPKVTFCSTQVKLLPAPGYMVVVSNFQQAFTRSLSPANFARIELSIINVDTGSSLPLLNQYASMNSMGMENSAVTMAAPNPIHRGRCGVPLTLRVDSFVRVSQRAAGPANLASASPYVKIQAVPCN